jgi:hypothetical protein
MVLLSGYLVFGILLTIDYAIDSMLSGNEVYIYGGVIGQIITAMAIMWIFMGLATPFLVLDTNLVLFHIFLTHKGLTTFQYITAVEERKEYKKELEYAMKILGGNKKTCLDFVLCLKKRKVDKEQPVKQTELKETPKGEQEFQKIIIDDKYLPESLSPIKKTPNNPASHMLVQNNVEEGNNANEKIEVKENAVHSADATKSQIISRNPGLVNSERTSLNGYEKEFLDKKKELAASLQPLVLRIQRDQDKKKNEQRKRSWLRKYDKS